MAETEKEFQILQKQILQLADRCYKQNMYIFTGFLGESDQDAFFGIQDKLTYVPYTLYGGNDVCERKMLRFGSEEQLGYKEPFPICLVKIEPLMQKFADKLTHRDFLGALMHLGIERDTMGDIFIQENKGYVFCTEIMAPYLVETLDQVKHTHVKCSIMHNQEELQKEDLMDKTLIVASTRIDGVISKLYNMSRSQSLDLFRANKIRVGGRLCTSNSYMLKEQDTVSVRGFGKFIYEGFSHETRKGKESIKIKLYQNEK